MKELSMSLRLAGAAAALVLAIVSAAAAQPYPTHGITLIVPFAAGGPNDTVARLVSTAMAKTLGQPVAVENVGGAGGNLGTARAAKAAPDGYTLLLHNISLATSATLYRKLPYDTLKAFDYVGLVADVPMTLVARPDIPPDDLRGLIDYVGAHKNQVTLANAGVGAGSHLCGMLFMRAIGTPLTTVPFTGTGPAMTNVVGGQVDLLCDQTTNTVTQIRSGKVKAFATTSRTRLAALPQVPTTIEAGLPDLQITIWHGLYAPKGTPAAVLNRLGAALRTALHDPHVTARLEGFAASPASDQDATAAALRAKLESEVARWAPVIKAAGIYAD
jgi:tripartite-type tricarboxylate transporter receptor subunit TctC